MPRKPRIWLAAIAVAALSVTGVTGTLVYLEHQRDARELGEPEFPSSLGKHLEKLKESIPGKGGESEEGPGSSADAAFNERAYPGTTISVGQMDAARTSWARASQRKIKPTGSWQLVGPSEALYPASPLRDSSSYVPNAYVASGRTTDAAIARTCEPGNCRLYVTPAGGGVWRTDDALAATPTWVYLGGPLGINAAGSVTIDPTDPDTVWVGTGEANTCGSGCVAGVGLYKSTDAGAHWSGPLGKDELGGKGIAEIAVDPTTPNVVYAATTTALRGMSSVCCSGVTRPVPGAAQWGLYKSTDGGTTWTFIHNGSANTADCHGDAAEFANRSTCSPRGVRAFEIDPSNHQILYAGSYARGIWRSPDAGATWTQIKPSLNASVIQTRPAFDVVKLADGRSRMYVVEGNTGNPAAQFSRSDDVATGTPAFTTLSNSSVSSPGYATYNICGGQCWYDLFVTSPDANPDMVYVGGSYAYGEPFSNKRGVVMSRDAGASATDMTMDATDPVHPNGLHPDQHSLVVNPSDPGQFFETNDGGIMRSDGTFVDRSADCDGRGLSPARLARCQQLLSSIPGKLTGINDGLSTLQFTSLSVSPADSTLLQGGTQDNGTWENKGKIDPWVNTMIGDGGASGWDVARPEFRFHNFYDVSTDVNFNSGNMADWIWTADPLYGIPGNQFYAPVISDPMVSGTMFAGTGRTVHRTKTFGLGDRTVAEASAICNEWTGSFSEPCGDWAELGATPLTSPDWGSRAGGAVVAVERFAGDTHTAWAATSTGRVFVTHNVDADPPSAVTWTRVDDDSSASPNRFVTSIWVPNGSQAYISYSGFNSATPSTPGHVFQVKLSPDGTTSTWSNLSYDFGDLPVNDLVQDSVKKDLYAATDFGVLRLPLNTSSWIPAATGLPNVEVAGLTIAGKDRVLYAATHGRSAWKVTLP